MGLRSAGVSYSAVITTYNRAAYVTRAVESVLTQKLPPREVIVVDDGSTDDTEAALSGYVGRLRYVRQPNQGRAAARNTGLSLASTPYVAFLDSDDQWLIDKMGRQMAILEADPELAMVHGHVEIMDAQEHPLEVQSALHRRWHDETHARTGNQYALWALRCLCFTSTVVAARGVLQELGGYDVRLSANEDLDLYLRIALDHRIELVEWPPVARYRLHSGNTSDDELAWGQIQVCDKHLELLRARPDSPELRLARRNLRLSIARSSHILRDPRAVRRNLHEALRLDPFALLIGGAWRRYLLSWLPHGFLGRWRSRIARSRIS